MPLLQTTETYITFSLIKVKSLARYIVPPSLVCSIVLKLAIVSNVTCVIGLRSPRVFCLLPILGFQYSVVCQRSHISVWSQTVLYRSSPHGRVTHSPSHVDVVSSTTLLLARLYTRWWCTNGLALSWRKLKRTCTTTYGWETLRKKVKIM